MDFFQAQRPYLRAHVYYFFGFFPGLRIFLKFYFFLQHKLTLSSVRLFLTQNQVFISQGPTFIIFVKIFRFYVYYFCKIFQALCLFWSRGYAQLQTVFSTFNFRSTSCLQFQWKVYNSKLSSKKVFFASLFQSCF